MTCLCIFIVFLLFTNPDFCLIVKWMLIEVNTMTSIVKRLIPSMYTVDIIDEVEDAEES